MSNVHSQAEIARQIGVSRCGVQAIQTKQQKTEKVEDRKQSGRPQKLTKKDGTYLKITSFRNSYMGQSDDSMCKEETGISLKICICNRQ